MFCPSFLLLIWSHVFVFPQGKGTKKYPKNFQRNHWLPQHLSCAMDFSTLQNSWLLNLSTPYNWIHIFPVKKTLKLRYQISQMDFHKIPVLGRDTFTGEMSRFFFWISGKEKMAAKLQAPHLNLCQLQLGKTRSSSNSCLKASDIHVLRRNPLWWFLSLGVQMTRKVVFYVVYIWKNANFFWYRGGTCSPMSV